jgi:hypothetical protein
MTAQATSSTRVAAALAAAVLGAAGVSLPARAVAAPESLREGLFGPKPNDGRQGMGPAIGRYVSADGDAFVLDRSVPRPLLKFDNSPEVWALSPYPAPRGDTIYKNDLGEPVLRATRLGGITVFTNTRPGGSAAALAGPSAGLRLAGAGPQMLLERLGQASARASRAARRLIPFDAEATPGSAALIADAAMVTSEAIIAMSRKGDARSISQIGRVRLVEGKKAQVQFDKGVMTVSVAPAQGLAGRPSSMRIAAAAKHR